MIQFIHYAIKNTVQIFIWLHGKISIFLFSQISVSGFTHLKLHEEYTKKKESAYQDINNTFLRVSFFFISFISFFINTAVAGGENSVSKSNGEIAECYAGNV